MPYYPLNAKNTEVFGNTGELIAQMLWFVVALALVIVLIVVVIKWMSKRSSLWGASRSLRSLGGISTGQQSSVQVIEIAGRVYIVGVSQTITLLDKIDDEQQVLELIAQLEQRSEGGWAQQSASRMIGTLLHRKGRGEQATAVPEDSAATFQQMLQHKLDEQSEHKHQLESLLRHSKSNERLRDDE